MSRQDPDFMEASPIEEHVEAGARVEFSPLFLPLEARLPAHFPRPGAALLQLLYFLPI
jgi:hypothetical protein